MAWKRATQDLRQISYAESGLRERNPASSIAFRMSDERQDARPQDLHTQDQASNVPAVQLNSDALTNATVNNASFPQLLTAYFTQKQQSTNLLRINVKQIFEYLTGAHINELTNEEWLNALVQFDANGVSNHRLEYHLETEQRNQITFHSPYYSHQSAADTPQFLHSLHRFNPHTLYVELPPNYQTLKASIDQFTVSWRAPQNVNQNLPLSDQGFAPLLWNFPFQIGKRKTTGGVLIPMFFLDTIFAKSDPPADLLNPYDGPLLDEFKRKKNIIAARVAFIGQADFDIALDATQDDLDAAIEETTNRHIQQKGLNAQQIQDFTEKYQKRRKNCYHSNLLEFYAQLALNWPFATASEIFNAFPCQVQQCLQLTFEQIRQQVRPAVDLPWREARVMFGQEAIDPYDLREPRPINDPDPGHELPIDINSATNRIIIIDYAQAVRLFGAMPRPQQTVNNYDLTIKLTTYQQVPDQQSEVDVHISSTNSKLIFTTDDSSPFTGAFNNTTNPFFANWNTVDQSAQHAHYIVRELALMGIDGNNKPYFKDLIFVQLNNNTSAHLPGTIGIVYYPPRIDDTFDGNLYPNIIPISRCYNYAANDDLQDALTWSHTWYIAAGDKVPDQQTDAPRTVVHIARPDHDPLHQLFAFACGMMAPSTLALRNEDSHALTEVVRLLTLISTQLYIQKKSTRTTNEYTFGSNLGIAAINIVASQPADLYPYYIPLELIYIWDAQLKYVDLYHIRLQSVYFPRNAGTSTEVVSVLGRDRPGSMSPQERANQVVKSLYLVQSPGSVNSRATYFSFTATAYNQAYFTYDALGPTGYPDVQYRARVSYLITVDNALAGHIVEPQDQAVYANTMFRRVLPTPRWRATADRLLVQPNGSIARPWGECVIRDDLDLDVTASSFQ